MYHFQQAWEIKMKLKILVPMLAMGAACVAVLSLAPRGSLAQSPSSDQGPASVAPTATCSGQGSSYICRVVFHDGPTCVVSGRGGLQCLFGGTYKRTGDEQICWTAGGPNYKICEVFMSGGPTCVVSVGEGLQCDLTLSGQRR
jgi:hypothetical protein